MPSVLLDVSDKTQSAIASHGLQLVSATLPVPSPPVAHVTAAAALTSVVNLLRSPKHANKLLATLPMHRVIMILVADNPVAYIALPCLELVVICLESSVGNTFRKKFESEGGFALLAKTLSYLWNREIQAKSKPATFSPAIVG